MSDRRNILYIMTDQQRYATLGSVGETICRTPNLNRLAAQGVRFDKAYSVCALCTPARTSMLTGLYPHNHMLLKNTEWSGPTALDFKEGTRLISNELIAAGYNAGYAGKWHCGTKNLPSTFGFTGTDVPGYGSAYSTDAYRAYISEHGYEPPKVLDRIGEGWTAGKLGGPPEACSPAFLAQYTIDTLKAFADQREKEGKPFLMVLSFWGPHAPYLVPEPYASMYDPGDIDLWASFADDLEGKPTIHRRFLESSGACIETKTFSEEVWRRVIALYFGYSTFIDAEIGRVLHALEALGLQEDTAVLFTTDHGDMTGTRGGMFDKGPMMYDDTYHIPMIASVPWLSREHTVSTQPVLNMDLAATVLDLAGIPVPESYDARSIVPLLSRNDTEWRDDIMCEFHGHRFLYSQRMVRWDNYKYVFNPPDIDEFYDLGRDPAELTNQINSPEYADLVREGKERLCRWMEDSDDKMLQGSRELLIGPL